jgi:3-phenylpropionate/trans-cinnamate dioxygenase ferredoxin reductase component
VFLLRTLDEAALLRERMAAAKNIVVIGAGFIGLEFAATATKLGASVTVLDVADRPMARALSKTMSAVFTREHEKAGVRLMFNTQALRLLGEPCVTAVETVDGKILPADLVLIGIGVIPNVELAATCNLTVENGIVVDEFLQTSDPHISAIGDVAAFPCRHFNSARVRLESVQNACDQARCVAARIMGEAAAYDAVPWFWSTQGSLKLQMAGLPSTGCEEVVRGDPSASKCSVFLFSDGKLACVETLNRPADHMLARRLLAERTALTPKQAADPTFDLKSLLPSPVGRARSVESRLPDPGSFATACREAQCHCRAMPSCGFAFMRTMKETIPGERSGHDWNSCRAGGAGDGSVIRHWRRSCIGPGRGWRDRRSGSSTRRSSRCSGEAHPVLGRQSASVAR